MTDQRRRIIERAALTGDPSAASALLTERLRDGSLTRERLEIAAWCGDPAAHLACPDAPAPLKPSTFAPHERHEAFSGFVEGLARWGDVVLVRAGCAAARKALTRYLRGPGAQSWNVQAANEARRQDTIAAVIACEVWAACPCAPCRITAHQFLVGDRLPTWANRLVSAVAFGPETTTNDVIASVTGDSIHSLCGVRAIRDAICASLISWSLGGSPT